MMALSTGLDGMVLAEWVVGNASIVQNFQSAVDRLKYCAGVQAHRMILRTAKFYPGHLGRLHLMTLTRKT
jgi:hypothetical protein